MPALGSRKRRTQSDPDSFPELAQASTTQRRRISDQADDEDDADASDADASPDLPHSEAVRKLVRLALASEYQRKPIRRADLSAKVLGSQGRQFKKVFEGAQAQLRAVFGMEMVELHAREKVTVREKRAQNASVANKPTTSWVLRTTLPSAFHDPEILPPPAAPTSAEESVYTAIYTLLVSLISLSGGSVPEARLERYLRLLGLEDYTPVATHSKTEALLKRLEKDRYLVKVKETAFAGEVDVSWVVGPRGLVEVGDDGVRGLAEAVYGELGEDGERDLQRRIARSLGLGERERREDERGDGSSKAKGKRRGRKKKDDEDDEEEVADEE